MNPYFDIDSIVKIAIMASQHKEYFKERNFRGEKFLRNSRMAFQYAKKEFREKKFSLNHKFYEEFYMGINHNETDNFITRIVHLFRKIRKVINKI